MAYSRADNNQPTTKGQRKFYLPRIDLNKYNVTIDGINFYDNPIESDNFLKHYKLIAVNLSKQKELDADPRAI